MKEQLEILRKEGYARLSVNDTVYRISEVLASEELLSYPIELLVDRLTVSDDKTLKSRLADSAETAFFEGHGTCLIRIYTEEGVVVKEFSKKFEADGMIFEEPTDMMFSFIRWALVRLVRDSVRCWVSMRIWWCLIKACLSTKEPWFAGKVR